MASINNIAGSKYKSQTEARLRQNGRSCELFQSLMNKNTRIHWMCSDEYTEFVQSVEVNVSLLGITNNCILCLKKKSGALSVSDSMIFKIAKTNQGLSRFDCVSNAFSILQCLQVLYITIVVSLFSFGRPHKIPANIKANC